MGELIQLTPSANNKPRVTPPSTFVRWLKNLFHVHEWEDTNILPVVSSSGEELGAVFIQKCKTCNLRCCQRLDCKGMSKRKLL